MEYESIVLYVKVDTEEAQKNLEKVKSEVKRMVDEIVSAGNDIDSVADNLKYKWNDIFNIPGGAGMAAEALDEMAQGLDANSIATEAVNELQKQLSDNIQKVTKAQKNANTATQAGANAQKANAAATTAATVATSAWGVALKVVRGILMSLGIGLITAGISLLTDGIKNLVEALTKWITKGKEAKRAQEEFNKKVADTAAEPLASLRRLQKQWNSLGNDLEAKQKFIDENKKAFNQLGLAVNSVSDAENILVRNTSNVIKALMLRARANAMAENIEEKAKAVNEKQNAVDEAEKAKKDAESERDKKTRTTTTTRAGLKITKTRTSSRYQKKVYDAIDDVNEANAELQKANEELDAEITKQVKLLDEADKILKNAGIESNEAHTAEERRKKEDERKKKEDERNAEKARKDAERKKKEAEEQAKRANDAFAKSQKQYEEDSARREQETQWAVEQVSINAMKDGLPKTLRQLELNHKKEMAVIARQEQEKIDAYKENKKKEWDASHPDKKGEFDMSSLDVSRSRMQKLASDMERLYGGNVDLINRKIIDAEELLKKGWEDAGEGIATLFSSQYGIQNGAGEEVEILVTPILPDGTVLSEDELEEYIQNTLSGAEDILAADTRGIVIKVGDAGFHGDLGGDELHKMQEEYYDLAQIFNVFDVKRINSGEKWKQSEQTAMQEIIGKKKDYLAQLADMEKEYRENRSALVKQGATEEQLAFFDKKHLSKLNAFYDEALGDYKTYEQRRLEIAERYANKRELLYQHNADGSRKKDANGNDVFVEGMGQGNVTEIDRQEVEEINNLIDSTASQLSVALYGKTIEELKHLRDEAARVLEKAKASPMANTKKGQEAIKKAEKELEAYNQAVDEAVDKSLAKWNKVAGAVGNLGDAFISLSDAIDDANSESIAFVGDMFNTVSTTIDGITKLTEISSKSIEGVSESAATAIKAVESASVVLTIISAAIKLMKELSNAFDLDGSKKQAEQAAKAAASWQNSIDRLTRSYDDLSRAIENAYSTERAGLMRQQIALKEQLLEKYKRQFEELLDEFNITQHGVIEFYEKYIRQSAEALGMSLEEYLESIGYTYEEFMIELVSQYSPELADQLREIYGNIRDTGEEIEDLENGIEEAVWGQDIRSAIEAFGDALIGAWTNGTDAAMAGQDAIRDMIKRRIREELMMEIQKEKILLDLQDKIERAKADGIITEAELAEILSMGDEAAEALSEKYKEQFAMLQSTSERSASARGIATASQESVDELNGRMTAVQGHTFDIRENTNVIREHSSIIRNNTAAILGSVQRIEYNTEELHALRSDLHELKGSLDSIITIQGIKIRS